MSDKDRRDKDGRDQNKQRQNEHGTERTGYVANQGDNQSPSEARDARDRAEFDRDLRPNPSAGVNFGLEGPHPERNDQPGRTAYDVKELHGAYPELDSTDLKNLTILPVGTQLEEKAAYFDLRHPERGEIRGAFGLTANEDNLYVPKADTDYELWNRLLEHSTVPA